MDDQLLDAPALAALTSLIWIVVVGAGLGLGLRYLLPNRQTYGVLLLPAVGAAAAAITWVAMLWAGIPDGDWGWTVWVAAFLAAIVAPLVVALVVSGRRTAADAHERHVLSGGRA